MESYLRDIGFFLLLYGRIELIGTSLLTWEKARELELAPREAVRTYLRDRFSGEIGSKFVN